MDWPALITSIAVLVATVGTVYVNVRHLRPIRREVGQIDAAVNGKSPGQTTMVSQVQEMYDSDFPERTVDRENGDAILPILRGLAAEMAKLNAHLEQKD